MNIILAIIGIILSTRGWALHGMVNQYAQINRPTYLKSKNKIISLFLLVVVSCIVSIMALGMMWYWAFLIGIPAAIILPFIWEIIEGMITNVNFTFVTSLPASHIVIRICLGFIISMIALIFGINN